MKFRFSHFLLVMILSIIMLLSGCRYIEVPQLNSDIKEISVVVGENYPPYVFRDEEGNLSGILVDEWNLWSMKTGISVKLDAVNWDQALQLMKQGKYDVIDSIYKNEERSKLYEFSNPYTDIEVLVFFDKNISGITDIKYLKYFTVGVEKGNGNRRLLEDNGIDRYLEFDNAEDIIKAVNDNTINVFIMEKPTAFYYLHKYNIQNNFRYTGSQHIEQFHRAVKKENKELLKVVKYGFSQFSETERKNIHNKWFGFEYKGSGYIFYIKLFIAFIIIISIVLIIWNRTLKRAANQKTLELTNTIEKLQRSENNIKAIFKVMPDLLFIINGKGIFIDYQVADPTNLLFPPEVFLGKSVNEIFDSEISKKFMIALEESIQSGETKMIEYTITHEGEINYFEARIIKYDTGLVLAIIRDITERKLSDIKIYNMSIKDGVTGLYNRNYFEDEVGIRNNQKLLNCSIIICDLDGLKFINDTLGHAVGDEYLKIATNILKKCFTKEDTVIARIGGDEFGILMKDVSEKEVIEMKAKLKAMLEAINQDKVIPISISLGYSMASDQVRDLSEMFKEADNFMYKEKLHHKQSSKSDIVDILMKMLQTRDFATEGHCDRLQILSAQLAKRVGVTENQIQDIQIFSKFHDIGKIGVPDRVLFKPGRLTEEEFEEMKRHTEIGYRIAQSSPGIAHLADWILKHHEWWNGEGYPFGLKENDIPIQCRILSIVDAYDTMTSDRPYRKALSKEEAINELERYRTIQFDPHLIDHFLEII